MKVHQLSSLLGLSLCLASACGSQGPKAAGGQVRLSAKPKVASAAHANSGESDICATFTLVPYSFDASGNPRASGASRSFTTSSASPAVDQILGCDVAIPSYNPPAGALGSGSGPFNWAYLVSASNFTTCAADAGTLDPATVSPAPAFFAPINCATGADAELSIDYPVSISAIAQSGYIDISAGSDPIHQYVGCKSAEVADGGLRFGESFVLDGDPNSPLGLIALQTAGTTATDMRVVQYGGQTHAADSDPNAGILYNTYYTGQITQADALPHSLFQTFLSNHDQSHLFGAGGDAQCTGGEWTDSRHAFCLTTLDVDPNQLDQDPNVSTTGALADAFLYIPGTGYAAASVSGGGSSISIYSQMVANSADDYTAPSGAAVTANASGGFASTATTTPLPGGAGFNDGLESPTLQLSDADPNSSVVSFSGVYIDPTTVGRFIVGESTATDHGWATLSWHSGAGWSISAFQPFSSGGVPAGFGVSTRGCVVPPPACPCWSAALAQETAELVQAGFQGEGEMEAPILYDWGISGQSRSTSLLLESEGSDGYICESQNESTSTGIVSISASEWAACLDIYATTMVRNPCLLNGGAGPTCGGSSPDCKYDGPGQYHCDAVPCPFTAAQIIAVVDSAEFSPLGPGSECSSSTNDDGHGGTQSYVAINVSNASGSNQFTAAGALDATLTSNQGALFLISNPFFEDLQLTDAATALSCQNEVLSACSSLNFTMNQPVGCIGLDNCPSGQVCDTPSNNCVTPVLLDGLLLDPSQTTYNLAEMTSGQVHFVAQAHYSNGSTEYPDPATVDWAMSNNTCCSLDATPGVIDINAVGTATITATYQGQSTTATIEVIYQLPPPTSPTYVVTGDFNGDGKVDLAETWFGSGNSDGAVRVQLGNGDGTFSAPVTYEVGNYPWGLAVGDFDGDGYIDLAVGEFGDGTGNGKVIILRGDGSGGFSEFAHVPFPTGTGTDAYQLQTGVFNSHSHLDLVIASRGAEDVFLLPGNGDGTFQTAQPLHLSCSAVGLVTGDFNGDGHSDLVATCPDQSQVLFVAGNGDGTFRTPVSLGIGSSCSWPNGAEAGELNGDNNLDLVVICQYSSTLNVYLGNGDGTFQTVASYPSGEGSPTTHPAIGDFNHDGLADLAVGGLGSSSLAVLLGTGAGAFAPAVHYPVGSGPAGVASGDFNADGFADFAVADYYSNDITVIEGRGSASPTPLTISVWVNVDASGRGAYNPVIVDNLGPNPEAFEIYIGDVSNSGFTGGREVKTQIYSNGQYHYAPATRGSVGITENAWHMISITYDNATFTLYVDGSFVEAESAPGQLAVGDDATIGSGNWSGIAGGSPYFHGALDELAIWSRALSPSEIALLYGGGAPAPGNLSNPPWNSGLQAGYHFDEGSGMNLVDYSGNGHGGAGGGAPGWGTGVDSGGLEFTGTPAWFRLQGIVP